MSQSTEAAATIVPVSHPQLGLAGLRGALQSAFMSCHGQDANQVRVLHDTAVETRTILELLLAKGIITFTELEQKRRAVDAQLAEMHAKTWSGPSLLPLPQDPSAEILLDCASRLESCHAACCRTFKVHLTADEVRSGQYLWDLSDPYTLLRASDGTCIYFDTSEERCSIWRHRPFACRSYSCASDTRIWSDFDHRVIAASVMEARAQRAAARQRSDGEAT
jgi:hypothetical protein